MSLATTCLLTALCLCAFPDGGMAQDKRNHSADEATIREKVAKFDGRFTDDAVIWMDGYLRPMRQSEEFSERRKLRDPAVVGRKNVKMTTTVHLVQFSDEADMAYEYSTTHAAFDTADEKQHVEQDVPLLRVWRRVAGEWKIAAWFGRANEHSVVIR